MVFICFYNDEKCNAKSFDKKFSIISLRLLLIVNKDKIEHKKKFYKPLHDEIVAAVLGPKLVS